MDERHWWFASKLQQTFQFGGYDNPTLLEDFLSEQDVLDLINRFLSPGEPRKLFFYCDAAPPSAQCSPTPPAPGDIQTVSTSRNLYVVSQLTKDVLAQGCVCLYVLRRSVHIEVDASLMEKELFCGELRHSVLSCLSTLLTEVYNPILHSQQDWRGCSDETVTNFLNSFDKLTTVLCESATKSQIYHPILKKPDHDLRSYLFYGQQGNMQHRLNGGGGVGGNDGKDVLMECENLVGDWIGTIESLLIDTTDER